MAKYRCTVCNYIYDEEKEGKKFSELPDDWRCPVCNAPKTVFVLLAEAKEEHENLVTVSDILIEQIAAWGVKYVFGLPGTSSLGVVDAIRKNNKIKYFNYDNINGNIIIRQRKNGDKIIPLGMKGSKKLKDIFIDMKIPKEERELVPIIQFDENIAWVFSVKISELYKVTEETKKMLKISVRRKEK